ncbi:precorrin-2 dehydrogenase/sirohydrochlorin ferrochelatase [Bacillus ectoiniformans]|uniref:precorrin-2 dehydrogenase/sirohydrochlorin ferrochelatase family protein n=1 Tax=Bacillus ectoiniformans TaxID=1494429 RepID=UPI00195C8418|nr:NAD(P)-dependent oxidoreductase [Bacillus ectoiniformans]MBM7647821.1 precorrin-2 dehydrogenase/sirohydrochlorin ferrochelatase [Bacillus ectoiniformans]
MNLFPIHVNVDYKKVVIVGGGEVARQKAEALLPTKATIVVVSPAVNVKLEQYINEGLITWQQKHFEPSDLDNASFIFAVTNHEEVNNAVEEAAQHWQMLSRADAKGRVDFMNPAVVRRGEFLLTVSTSGASPGLTRKVKEELSEQYDPVYAAYVHILREGREKILQTLQGEQKKQALSRLLDPALLAWVRTGNEQSIAEFFDTLCKGEWS